MTLKTALVAIAALTVATPSIAKDFRAPNNMRVAATGDATFTVSGRAKHGARSYWCAAGDYARRKLNLSLAARLYVADAISGNTGPVGFSASPTGLEPRRFTSLSKTLRNPGAYISVGQAQTFCAENQIFFNRP